MLIGILSDTHNQRQRTQTAVSMLKAEGAEALIHCGDLVAPDLIDLCTGLPFYLVFGNNDINDAMQIESRIALTPDAICLGWGGEIELAGKRIAITHGHIYKLYRQLLAAEPDYLLTGHSHVMQDEREGKTRLINPGALHRAASYSVALLNLSEDELRFLSVPA